MVYNYILGASDVEELSYAAYDATEEEVKTYVSYSGYDVADIEVTRRTTTNAVVAMAMVEAGKNYLFAQTYNENLYTTSSVPVADLDTDLTPGGGVLVCGVGSNGGLFLFYGNIDNGEGFTEVELASGTTFDECAVAVTTNDILAIGARSGDSLYIGYAEYP